MADSKRDQRWRRGDLADENFAKFACGFIIQTELRILFHDIQREAKVTYELTLNRLWFCGAKNAVALKTSINIGGSLVLAGIRGAKSRRER